MATFGKTTDGSSMITGIGAAKFVSTASPSSSGIATKLTARLDLSAAGSVPAKGVIYSDNAGSPDALLATSDEVTVTNTTEQAIDLPFSGANQLTVSSGTNYWIGIHWSSFPSHNYGISMDSTSSGNKTNNDTYSDGPSDPFGARNTGTGILDCYVTYTEGATTTSTSTTTTSTSSSSSTTTTSTSTT